MKLNSVYSGRDFLWKFYDIDVFPDRLSSSEYTFYERIYNLMRNSIELNKCVCNKQIINLINTISEKFFRNHLFYEKKIRFCGENCDGTKHNDNAENHGTSSQVTEPRISISG